jgi:protein tyrosine phosphatase (PTP) superfamily phosphohydrolase (DUF442 family)
LPSQTAFAPPFNPFPRATEEPPIQAPIAGVPPGLGTPIPGTVESPRVTLGTPQADSPAAAAAAAQAQLNPPADSPQDLAQRKPAAEEVVYPSAVTTPSTSPPARIAAPDSLPVGIPEFSMISPGLAGGLRPMLDGGLDWLQSHGYQAVLHLKQPGEDDSADRKQVEKRGMKYLSLDVVPRQFSDKVVEQFTGLVKEQKHSPLFVYDRKGTLAGGLWFVYFRTALSLGEDEAREKARALGLRPNGDEAQRDMWAAVRNYISNK